ncbi:DUF418 domain-containing protein [uncultured Sphingomonas sp.]|uniref:DUF418 domain-containing protein n=1 Tax=uncultured Sphingomonas sp. TaxID=158754 RepID=UPI0035CA5583
MADDLISNEPDGAPRIVTLDVLRGVAILGILFMNIDSMGASFSYPDIRHLGWSAADRMAWWARQILADGTARCLLEMLFGAGMVILTDRIAQRAGRWMVMRRYYRRNLVLAAFGLIHMVVLLWPGDILHTYGLAAMIVFLFRRLPPRWLIAIGLIGATGQVVGVSQGLYKYHQLSSAAAAATARRDAGQQLGPADREAIESFRQRVVKRARARADTARAVALEDQERSSTVARWMVAAWKKSIERLGIDELFAIWEAAGTMLIGAALFRLGILQGERRPGFYARMAAIGYALAGGYRAAGAYAMTRFDDQPQWHWLADEFARIGMTLGHVGLLCLLLGTRAGGRILRPFAAAGRTALTIYVLQSIICVWMLFPPQGLALYGKLSWMPLMLTAVAIDAMLLALAAWYLRRFRIAPVEWAWRSIVDGRRLPLRR